MRNNLLNFAEFERETIAARVADAFQTKARETGFYQGGKVQFGYTPERRTVSALHEQKSELEKKMQTMCRKRKAIDTKPLEESMKQWDKLTVQ